MKTILSVFVCLIIVSVLKAQTTYTVSSNTNWNGVYPGYCGTCTFNISPGVTLTLNTNATCYNCTINGGMVTLTSDFTFQQSAIKNTTINLGGHTLNLQNNGTSLTNIVVNANRKSVFLPTGSISIAGSTFNFTDTSQFQNSGGTLNISASNLYFYGNSFFNATAGPVNLSASTQFIAGDGTTSSKAYLLFNGPVLNLVDASSALYAANKNNYYANWSSYNSLSNSKTYATSGLNKNCGGAGQNACSAQFYFGCASFSNSGPVTCSTLAESISDFKAYEVSNEIRLSWNASDISVNTYFQVERSINGLPFSPLSLQEGGTSNISFTYVDPSPAPGENEYRIAIIGENGTISYSHTLSIQTETQSTISIYPNPTTNGHFMLQMPTTEILYLTIYTMQGQIIYAHSFSGQLKYTVQTPSTTGRQQLAVHVVAGNKTATFNVLNIP
jgi:hypothetical protein